MAIQSITTPNFLISCNDDPAQPGLKRAQALATAVENELAVLQGWFDLSGGYGPDNRIQVGLFLPDHGGGNNGGYQTGGQTSIMTTAQLSVADDNLANQQVKAVFVAELAEVLMSQRGIRGAGRWNPGDSAGEGLSRLCAIERASLGYTSEYHVTVNTWMLSAARADWISQSKPTDTDDDSTGCAMLFLYYLHSQLYVSIPHIIQQGGGTLEATYHAVTGKNGGFGALRALLDSYFPLSQTPPLATNNPFPLLGGRYGVIDFDVQEYSFGETPIGAPRTASVQPGPLCPEGTYTFQLMSTGHGYKVVASTRNFGQPVYSWLVGGVPVAGSGTIILPLPVREDDAFAYSGLAAPAIENVTINFAISAPTPFTSQLDFTFPSQRGHFGVYFQTSAVEKFASPDVAQATSAITTNQSRIAWDQRHEDDRARCDKHFGEILRRYLRIAPILQHPPLPDPPLAFTQVLDRIEAISRELGLVADRSPDDARAIARVLAAQLGLSEQLIDGLCALYDRAQGRD